MTVLSVCITHYNRPEKLAATLESLANQTRPPDEVFLQDDHSPNDPTAVAMAFQHRFRRFEYERNTTNIGMPKNLNRVLAKASGDLVANLHDADEFHPQLLEKWEAALLRHPTAGIAFCGYDAATKAKGARTPGRIWIHDFDECTPGMKFFERAYVGSSGSPIWGTVMARREVYERHMPFDERFGMWADVDMWMRICGTHDIVYVNEPLMILDSTPTAVRTFNWDKILLVHSMPFVNIRRLARNDAERGHWLRRQRQHSVAMYLRHMASRLARGKFSGAWAGIVRMQAFRAMMESQPTHAS